MTPLEKIRAKCIEVKYDTIGFEHGEWAEKRKETIRLADVLLTLQPTGYNTYEVAVGPEGMTIFRDTTMGPETFLWNLREDDLEKQSEETITFLANLL